MTAKDITKTDKTIGLRINEYRMAAGMTLEDFADQIGVKYQQISKYEHGFNRICASRLQTASRVLQRPITDFYDDETEFFTANNARLMMETMRDINQLPRNKQAAVRLMVKALNE